ncbi:hypothetical protein O181_061046 [Austropuccinia psidii MF-1]|uniref:Uncharacterized protein n=1 Tax=Austropuccinia psidii MF-1 TaxID=1389203 RepID=A0A9Q3EM13_9BASI|nr:hypothetical protein [Austropuccinia psidii MF-1]
MVQSSPRREMGDSYKSLSRGHELLLIDEKIPGRREYQRPLGIIVPSRSEREIQTGEGMSQAPKRASSSQKRQAQRTKYLKKTIEKNQKRSIKCHYSSEKRKTRSIFQREEPLQETLLKRKYNSKEGKQSHEHIVKYG